MPRPTSPVAKEESPLCAELKTALKSLAVDHAEGLDAKAATRNRSRSGSRAQSRQSSLTRSGNCSRQCSYSFDQSGCASREPSANEDEHEGYVSERNLDMLYSKLSLSGSCQSSTAIVLDWDDTLCPTTWFKEDCMLDWTAALSELPGHSERNDLIRKLAATHSECVSALLREASKHGTVIILTLANSPWVEISLQNWMPEVMKTIEECAACIVYAQNFVSETDRACIESSYDDFASDEVWSCAKEMALLDKLQPTASKWTQVVSIGDADFERVAANRAATQLNLKCVSKTLKLLEDPSIEELSAELIMLRHWIPHLCAGKEELHCEIETPEDDILQEIHEKITGQQDSTLSWENLCGTT